MQDQTRSPGTRNLAGKHPHLRPRPQQRHPMPVRACACDGYPPSDVQLSQDGLPGFRLRASETLSHRQRATARARSAQVLNIQTQRLAHFGLYVYGTPLSQMPRAAPMR